MRDDGPASADRRRPPPDTRDSGGNDGAAASGDELADWLASALALGPCLGGL